MRLTSLCLSVAMMVKLKMFQYRPQLAAEEQLEGNHEPQAAKKGPGSL
jgi:hypothetical protein